MYRPAWNGSSLVGKHRDLGRSPASYTNDAPKARLPAGSSPVEYDEHGRSAGYTVNSPPSLFNAVYDLQSLRSAVTAHMDEVTREEHAHAQEEQQLEREEDHQMGWRQTVEEQHAQWQQFNEKTLLPASPATPVMVASAEDRYAEAYRRSSAAQWMDGRAERRQQLCSAPHIQHGSMQQQQQQQHPQFEQKQQFEQQYEQQPHYMRGTEDSQRHEHGKYNTGHAIGHAQTSGMHFANPVANHNGAAAQQHQHQHHHRQQHQQQEIDEAVFKEHYRRSSAYEWMERS